MVGFSVCNIQELDKELTQIKGPFSELEYKEMREESNRIVDILKEHIFQSNSTTPNLIRDHISSPINQEHKDSFVCKSCLWTFGKFHNLLDKKYGLTLFNEFLTILCSIGLKHKICQNAIDLYSSIIIDSIVEHYLDAEFICTKSKICKNSHFIELNPDDYARELLKDKPLAKVLNLDESAKTLKVLHVTDFHTDLLYNEVI